MKCIICGTEPNSATTKNKIYCDHCGKELGIMHDYDDMQIDMAYKWITADLCAECLDKLYDLVCDFCERKGGEG